MSVLGCYSDSRSCPCSDTPWTPTHVRTRTLLGLPLMSVLGCYSDSCSLPRSDSTRNPTLVVLSIRLSEYSSTSLQSRIHVYQPHSELRVYPHYEFSELHSDAPLRRLLRHLCLNLSYKSEPAPLDLHPRPHYNLNPCHPTPLGGPLGHPLRHPCLTLSYIQAHAFGARSDLCHCPHYECHMDPNRS
jgi:hypothetical protein